jgi:NAD+-dependent farnesol dehydrogenase
MNKYFVSGGTGFIGIELTKKLIGTGDHVHLLVRDKNKTKIFNQTGITVFEGDITSYSDVDEAMKGCSHVFHLAAHAKPFAKDPAIFDRINIDGTRNILEAALKYGITRVVFTSTAGTFGTTSEFDDVTEESEKPETYYTDYARTKRIAEKICDEYLGKGLNIITVYPTRVFGPGLLSESNGILKILKLYQKGKWRIIPGNGKTFGNYVYIDDVIYGHLLAMQKGKTNEGYILGGENLTFDELFSSIRRVSGKNYVLFHIPYPVLWMGSAIMVAFARLFNRQPLISPGWVKRYLQHRRLSSMKATNELDYQITPVQAGLVRTLEWLNQNEMKHGKQN